MTSVWTPRVTVAAVIEREGRFLMVEEETDEGAVFNQPAGHLEQGEGLQEAVIREIREETAWGFEPVGLVGVYRWPMPDGGRTYLRFCFYGDCSDQRPERPLDTGILGTRWLTRKELEREERLRSPMVLHCIDDYLAGRSYPLELIRDIL
jgi:ADP-ribose pyrophosphatase YjhB (NUDIX family)